MRLIDADKLAKKWTIASPEPYNTDAVEVLDSIKESPTVDAVSVVRCEDCAFSHSDGWVCSGTIPQHQTDPDNFCSYGERKTRKGGKDD